jgi:hypothetical protein
MLKNRLTRRNRNQLASAAATGLISAVAHELVQWLFSQFFTG